MTSDVVGQTFLIGWGGGVEKYKKLSSESAIMPRFMRISHETFSDASHLNFMPTTFNFVVDC